MDVDVVIVGAGFAGLAAARALAAAERSIVVLEARDRVGGRVVNETTADGTPLEMGGQWIGPTQTRMAELAAELGVATYPTHHEGRNIVRFGGADLPPLADADVADMARAQQRLDDMARAVPLDAPWTAAEAADWDAQTVETWIRSHMATPLGRELMRLGIRAVFAAEPAEISLLHMLFYSHSGGLLDSLFDVEGGAQETRFVGGSQQLAVRMADGLGDRVRLGTAVTGIAQDGDGVTVSGPWGSVRGRRALVTVPPALAGHIRYDPPLDPAHGQLFQRMPMGSVIKCQAVYDEPFWRAAGWSGQATGDAGPVQLTFDNSPPAGTPGVLVAFVEGNHARRLSRVPADERRRQVLECLVGYFGPRAAEPVEFLQRDWSAERWTGGCYGAHLPPGVLTGYGPALRRPHGRVHWAGTEVATVWAGYMEGAVRSGEEAAAGLASAD